MSRILIVDDDGETCRFMAELLDRPDREIRTTQNATEALTLAKQPFDLLISDINLDAQQNGMDVLRAFKQANPRGTSSSSAASGRCRPPSMPSARARSITSASRSTFRR